MQPSSSGARSSTDPCPTECAVSEHELAQERMYLIWRSGRLANKDTLLAQMWGHSLDRLRGEGSMDYFVWLMQRNARIYSAEK